MSETGAGERKDVTGRPGERIRTARPSVRHVSAKPPAQRKDGASALKPLVRPALICGKYLLPLVVLAVLAAGLFYVRILYGPVSLKMLAEPIARSITAELPGFSVTVEDALVRLNEEGQVEFRLRNVRLLDDDGDAVAVAPLAAVEISGTALRRARLAPAKVVLIEPRVLLEYSEESGLAFSFARPDGEAPIAPEAAAASPAAPSANTRGSEPVPVGLPIALRELEMARLIAETTARARRNSDAASYLKELGFRNATVLFDYAGKQNTWLVEQADIALSHKRVRSIIEGNVRVASDRGPWSLNFWTEASDATQQVALKASIRDLVPRSLASALPGLLPLQALDLPANGEITLDLTSHGEVQGGAFSLDLARGQMRLPWLADAPLDVEGGRLNLRYVPGERLLRIATSTLVWGQNRLTLQGQVVSSTGKDGAETWGFDLAGVEGQLVAEDLKTKPLPLEGWVAQGAFKPATGKLTVDQYAIQAGGGQIRFAGTIADDPSELRLEGQIGPMPRDTLLALWPRSLGTDARTWVAEHVPRGTVDGGHFTVTGGHPGRGSSSDLSLTLQASNLLLEPVAGFPQISVPHAVVQFDETSLSVTMPEGSAQVSEGRQFALKAGRFTAVDLKTDHPTGQIALQAEGPAADFLELLERDAVGINRLDAVNSGTVEGKIEGHLSVTLPLRSGISLRDIKVEGRGKVTDGRARRLIGNRDAQAATVTVDISEKAIDARGDMLLSGVPVKLGWQHIFDAPPDKQPPLRLTATLDGSDRAQLGLDIEDIVQGEIPVEVTITKTESEDHHVLVRADLSRAEMVLEGLAWRKPQGRSAALQFTMAAGARQNIDLHNFQIVGDDIAINGRMVLDANNRLKEFNFPEFSVSLISRLNVRGVLRNDKVWEVTAKGQTYDGRDFFRSMFSVGELGDRLKTPRKDAPGLELKADIDTVLGFSDVSLRGFTMQLSQRGERLTRLSARGMLDGGKPLEVELHQGEPRQLVATTDDAGQAFRLVDFYPSLVNGRLRLEVNLDGRGAAEKTGLLRVERFRILGDPIVSEVLRFDETHPPIDHARSQRVVRQVFDFDWMRVPFSVGHGQFVMGESEIRGPLVGATMRGKADIRSRQVNIGGTYVPLQGLNSAVGIIPGLGQLLAGPRGEGVLGITFAIRGPMNQPQVLVNPLSLVAPGIFREMFQLTRNQSVVAPPANTKAPAKRSSTSAKSRTSGTSTQPEVLSGWSSETSVNAPKKK